MELSRSPLEHTFIHLPRIGPRTEMRLWGDGIFTWADLEEARRQPADLFGIPRDDCLVSIEASREALSNKDADYFAARLPSWEHYRVAATFPEDTVFLDIETTGLSLYYDNITLIGLSRGTYYACWFPDAPKDSWQDLLSDAKCLVTFNGTAFDLKFLERLEDRARLPRAHIDLRYFARRAQLKGGQKEIERELGFERPEQIGNATGADAVRLWYEYRNGDLRAGRDLVQYNHSDVEGMKAILDETIRRIGKNQRLNPPCPFASVEAPVRFESRVEGDNFVEIPRFQGRTGPRVTYEDLFGSGSGNAITVIGIDLTGAERRPSGWCVLTGRQVETCMVKTDAEMIEAIAAIRPQVVSIDSPLSLPRGRVRVDDGDPGRDKYGIMRECERMLKRRGINVYPCLIPSMQQLTARGMRLAAEIRALGIPVIESYPGAAQDIMDIPRKRASLMQLKEGLRLFGVEGRSLSADANPTHDELDAITSAIVGLFFWSGWFEALGNEDEDYLIIPEVSDSRENQWQDRFVVGVSGPISSGKTTVARWLEQRDFAYGRYSQVVEDETVGHGKAATKQTLQEVGQRIRVELGQRWLNCQLLGRLRDRGRKLVVDGLRWPEDRAFWIERYGPAFFHVHLDAAAEIRRRRYVHRHGLQADFEGAASHAVEQGVEALQCLADHVLPNEGERQHILCACDQVLAAHLGREDKCPSP